MLSLTTISILAWAKIIGFSFVFWGLYLIWTKKTINYWLIGTVLVIVLFYWVLAKDLQTMLSGNIGDELFILAYLSKTLAGHLGHDFYYDHLPQFYPPLYFWLTGILAKPLVTNAIGAAKLGVFGTLMMWLLGAYYYQKVWWTRIVAWREKNLQSKAKPWQIVENKWFWYLYPVLYFLSLDFSAIIFKPYEAISALFGVLLLVFFSRALWQKVWPQKYYLFFGISAGLVFLTFYFWFVIFIPVVLVLIFLMQDIHLNLKKLFKIFLVFLPLALVFVGPLLWSYIKYGVENAQATHFVAQDFFSFLPWQNFNLQSILFLLGLISLFLFYKKSAIKSMAWVVICSFAYQILNLLLFISGFKPIQASKPFYFLTTAALIFAASYLLIYLYQKYQHLKNKRIILSVVFILLVSLLPHFSFIEKPGVLEQLEKDLVKPEIASLAQDLKNVAPDYQKYTWLSSGSSELNAYLPISYYLANSAHFSHHAALFTERLDKLKNNELSEEIDALLLYDDSLNSENYILNFWIDNYPNGGRDEIVYLSKSLIQAGDWQEVYHKNNWLIFLKKY